MGRGTAHTVMFYVIRETCAKNRNVCFARQKCVAFVLVTHFPKFGQGRSRVSVLCEYDNFACR